MKRVGFLMISAAAAFIMTGCNSSSKHETSSNAKHSTSKHGGNWSYEGAEGPKHWGELAADYKLCSEGKEQSPINIEVTKNSIDKDLVIDYKSTGLDEVNNGHTIKFNYDAGSFLTVAGKKYQLLQFHFHAPSENTVDAAHYPIEFHLVHQSEDKELAVVGIMVKEGAENSNFKDIISNLTYENGGKVKKGDIKIDMSSILPATDKFAHFTGSLTTPPCSEKVQWFVLSDAIEFSKEQIAAFEKAYNNNNRPVQPLNERTLYTK